MTGHTTHPAIVAERHRSAAKAPGPVCRDPESLTGESTALRDDAATLEFIARRWARLLPAGRTDVRADIALLEMIAGNARGYAGTMEGDQ